MRGDCHISPSPAIIPMGKRIEPWSPFVGAFRLAPIDERNCDSGSQTRRRRARGFDDRSGAGIRAHPRHAARSGRDLRAPSPAAAPRERWWIRLMWFVIALAIVWGHFYLVRSFWAPAHPGVDQN